MYGAPLAAPNLQSFNTAPVSRLQGTGQQQAMPLLPPQQQQHQQQWTGSSGSLSLLDQQMSEAAVDPFAAFEPASSVQASRLPEPSQQTPSQQQYQPQQQQLNPFDESSQPFMPRQSPALQVGSLPEGHHSFPDLIPDVYPQPLLGSIEPSQDEASQQSPLDDMLRPQPQVQLQIPSQLPPRALQHTQSVPRALPRPKPAVKRHTEPTQGPSYAPSSQTYQPSQAGSSINFDSFTTTSSAPSAMSVLANPFASGFGDMSLARPSAPVLRVKKADMSPSGSPSGSPTKGDLRGHTDAPLAFDARLPPLHPKLSARLTLLAAAHGSLFAGPSCGGGLLQWARPEGNMRQPKGANASE